MHRVADGSQSRRFSFEQGFPIQAWLFGSYKEPAASVLEKETKTSVEGKYSTPYYEILQHR